MICEATADRLIEAVNKLTERCVVCGAFGHVEQVVYWADVANNPSVRIGSITNEPKPLATICPIRISCPRDGVGEPVIARPGRR